MTAAHARVWRTALAFLVAALVLGACGRAVAPPTPAPVTVRFAYRSNVTNYNILANEFHEKYPNITVELVSSSSMQSQTQGQTLGMGPSLTLLKMQSIDIFRDTLSLGPDPQLKNELLALDEFITANRTFPKADFLPGLIDAMKIDGVQIGMPAGVNPIVAYYDAYRLRMADTKPPTATWTLTDFVDIAAATNNQKGSAAGNVNYVIGFCSDPMGADPVVITYLMGGQLVDNLQKPTQVTMNSTANVQAVEWYANLRSTYGAMSGAGQADESLRRGVYQAISTGHCGVWIGFYGDMRGRSWGTLWLGEPVMMPLPRGRASFNAATMDGYFMLRSAAHPQEAWLWLMFLLDHEEAAGNLMPPRVSQIQGTAFSNRVTPDIVAVARGMLTTPLVSIGSTQDLGAPITVYVQAVAQVVRGEMDAKSALAAAQEKALPLLAR
jgi:ABC-type glycerol-3-phosphate transport system substrate-binding protein